MPYKIKLQRPLAGYAAASAKEGESVQVVFREFLTSEDGMKFIQRLEGISECLLPALPSNITIIPSQIDHLFAHFNHEGDGLIYINELNFLGEIRLKSCKKRGETVFENDIIDISKLRFPEIEIPSDHGIIFIFSKGWRKGLYFDLEPMCDPSKSRRYCLWNTFGHCYNYLVSQEVFAISEEAWTNLFNTNWFPFVTLSNTLIREMITLASDASSIDRILPRTLAEISEQIPAIRVRWEKFDLFKSHYDILKTALDRFESKDWISSSTLFYTRIEGILRDIAIRESMPSFNQTNLSNAAALHSSLGIYSRILPSKFQNYLNKVYFKSFDPYSPFDITRNTIGHGVAPLSEFTEKSSAIGLLIVDQLYFHIPQETDSNDNSIT